MKRRDLIRKIEEDGAVFIRHGGRHDWYHNPRTKVSQPVGRHVDINEFVARSIIKKLAGEKSG